MHECMLYGGRTDASKPGFKGRYEQRRCASVTFYDDAQFGAIRAVRIALSEHSGQAASAQIHAVAVDLCERHGPDGLTGLTVALSRFASNLVWALGVAQGTAPATILDAYELQTLKAIQVQPDN